MLYIICLAVLIVCEELFQQEVIGILLMFSIAALATGMLVYNYMSRTQYIKHSDTVVEEFKEFRDVKYIEKSLHKELKGAYWGIVTGLYFLISFIFGIWAFSWIIFIMAAAGENIINAIIILGGDKNEK